MNKYIDAFLDEKEEEPRKPLDINIIRTTLNANGYSLLRPVGQGGFASVFLIFSNQYSLEFVVKVSDYKRSHRKTEEFDLTEINHLINLNHPNIINMYKYFTDDYYLYVVLEYCVGGSLKDIITKSGRIRSAYLYNYCHQILTALKHCHDLKITHNDIKPANVLIDKNQRLKLADFGLSKGFSEKSDDHSIGKDGQILVKKFGGSRPYMAPELIHFEPYDPFKADIWSLGVTFYELSTGKLPWRTDDLKQMSLQISVGVFSFQNFKLPSEFCKIIHRMLEVNPQKRPSVDWLLDQPIFNRDSSGGNSKVRTSVINRSSSIGSIPLLRMRSRDRLLNMSFSSDCENDNKTSDSPIVSDNDNANSSALNHNNFQENQVPFSLLNPNKGNHNLANNGDDGAAADDLDVAAVPRKKVRRNVKLLRASMPTFL